MGDTKKDVGVILHKSHATFRVWAPFAVGVAVTGAFNNWSPTPMDSENDGYWAADIKDVVAGQEYKFVINTGNGELYKNDPRALHVTTTAGNSVITDPEFEWDDKEFKPASLNQQVMYEIHVGTFYRADPSASGTLDDAITKLDYLADLGINTVELMPINSMSNDRGWGYTTDYLYAVESLYGGRRAFLEFVNAAHKRGIGVVLDIVYNHLGPDGGLDMWQFDGWSQDGKGGIYFYNDWRSHTPWADTRPDYGRPEVRQYILDNVKMWMQDCRVDGLRVDSTGFIRTVNGHNNDPADDIPEGWSILQEITGVAKKINPAAVMVAEDLGCNEYLTKPQGDGGAGFATQWEVGMPHVLRDALDTIEDSYRNLGELTGMLEHRYNGDAFQRVIYSDSHDSAANGGARLSEEITPGNSTSLYSRRRSLLASAIILTAPGVPMLFQGQEFMEGGSFNDWRELDWEKAEKFDGIILAHKHLIALRKNLYGNARGLTGQSFKVLHLNEESKVMAYHRWDQGGAGDDVIVILNLANRVQKDYYVNFPRGGTWHVRFNSDWKGYSPDFKDTKAPDVNVDGDGAALTIAPYSILILSQD